MTYEQNRVQLREALAAMSGQPIGRYDYVAYFINDLGESLIFWVERSTGSSWLLQSVNKWEKLPIDHPAILLHAAELEWFYACLRATNTLSDEWTAEANKKVTSIEITV